MKKIISILGVLFISAQLYSQTNSPCAGLVPVATVLPVGTGCSYTTVDNIGATQQTNAANGGTPSCSSLGEDSWYSFIAPASGSVDVFSLAGTITDGAFAIYSGPCGSLSEVACNDDGGPGFMPQLTSVPVTPGLQYFLRIWEFGGGTGSFDVCIQEAAPPPPNATCTGMEPICSGTPIDFIAQSDGTSAEVTDPGNNYDCLLTTPNPSWYYLEIDSPGDLAIDITAGSDIDFAIWGPYTDLADAQANCNSYPLPLDCSYSTAATEQANVNGVLAGEVYVLLVTNYAATVQNININEAGSNTASTDCSIVPLPIELVSFDGVLDEKDVILNWTTATELNNSHFAIENSSDGISWNTIHIEKGQGTVSSETNYTFTDQNVSNGIQYYRLKQFDFDGTVATLNTISVNPDSEFELNIYPNPAKEKLTVKASSRISTIQITNLSGTLINTSVANAFSSIVDLSEMENGIYLVTVISEGRKLSKKLVVNK